MSDLFDQDGDPSDPFAEPPPIAPQKTPKTHAERAAWLRLARAKGVGPATFIRLLRRYASAAAALDALPQIKAGAGHAPTPPPPEAVEAELAAADRAHARMLCLGAPDYPALLARIDAPPPLLWVLGDPARLSAPAIAMVGARNASAVGRRWAETVAQSLAERGTLIVSGLARGIDAAAHQGALAANGRTAAAVAGGVEHVYPPEHRDLHARIAETGAVLSEMPIGFQPAAQHFPRRNRIISGLSQLTLVVEAPERSGALITARYAAEQNREAAAVPGHPLDPRYGGCNALLRQGAIVIRDADDAWEALQDARPRRLLEPGAMFDAALTSDESGAGDPDPETAPALPADLSARILAALGAAPIDVDALARAVDAAPAQMAAALLELELSGKIERRPGGLVGLL